jgi:hypothetical protein
MSLELSPGFFDPRMAMSDEEDEDNLVPNNVNVEELNSGEENNDGNNNDNNEETNSIVEFINFWFVTQKPCGCNREEGGWSRTNTY